MKGSQRISNLITNPDFILPGRINIIEANCSSGKTYFALNTIPEWAGNPERILYLIDTSNGEMRIQQNIITISRDDYAMADYCSGKIWGEWAHTADKKMPVMTYAGFGSEVRKGRHFRWQDFDYIICDEMQNLVNYHNFSGDNTNLEAAEVALQIIAEEKKTKIIALSATPQKIREHFDALCYDVPFDKSDLFRVETFAAVPYRESVETIIQRHKGETGILYTTNVKDMKRYIACANSIGVRANGFWSVQPNTQRDHPMDREQFALRDTILKDETIPANIDLLVINRASETCIKIDSKNRKIDYMIVHDKDKEIQTQVRDRYHGDLSLFYYHDVEGANNLSCQHLPARFLNTRLYAEEREALCDHLDLRKPDDPNRSHYKWPTVKDYLERNGYAVERKKDKKRNGRWYYVVRLRDTKMGELL